MHLSIYRHIPISPSNVLKGILRSDPKKMIFLGRLSMASDLYFFLGRVHAQETTIAHWRVQAPYHNVIGLSITGNQRYLTR